MTRADSEAQRSRIQLDVHAHVIPLREADVPGLSGVGWSERGRLVVDGAELPKRELYDIDALIAWMDAQRIATAWISVPPTLYRVALDADEANRWTRALNTAIARITAQAPRRLAAMFHLPVQHPDVAAAIARDAVALGHRRFAMPAGDAQRSRRLSDVEYVPLWEALDNGPSFLFLHPGRSCDPRFDALSLANLLGGPTETAIAAAHLAMSGVLERYAGITFCLAHGGGTIAAVAGRLARGQDTERPGAYTAGERVRVALTRCYVDCITHDPAALALAAATFGRDRILFGSDWPFDMGLPRPHEQLAGVAKDLLQRIFVDNPGRLP
ncbi:MAG TPA: amidohydrolase family protein [Casimicrobiaceae bacterium]|nr:amidohydrolase family protein [Casimicrobiaceae bacterium]